MPMVMTDLPLIEISRAISGRKDIQKMSIKKPILSKQA